MSKGSVIYWHISLIRRCHILIHVGQNIVDRFIRRTKKKARVLSLEELGALIGRRGGVDGGLMFLAYLFPSSSTPLPPPSHVWCLSWRENLMVVRAQSKKFRSYEGKISWCGQSNDQRKLQESVFMNGKDKSPCAVQFHYLISRHNLKLNLGQN